MQNEDVKVWDPAYVLGNTDYVMVLVLVLPHNTISILYISYFTFHFRRWRRTGEQENPNRPTLACHKHQYINIHTNTMYPHPWHISLAQQCKQKWQSVMSSHLGKGRIITVMLNGYCVHRGGVLTPPSTQPHPTPPSQTSFTHTLIKRTSRHISLHQASPLHQSPITHQSGWFHFARSSSSPAGQAGSELILNMTPSSSSSGIWRKPGRLRR